jgi:hypothetical protein
MTNQTSESDATPSGLIVELVAGDLLEQEVELIVNAWNQNFIPHRLLLTQGVSGAIKKRTGSIPFDELRKGGTMRLGEARFTQAPNLKFKGIIHVAGINHLWRSSEKSVRMCVRNALELATMHSFRSIAFPAIGAGSSLSLGKKREISLWGVSTSRSLELIEEEARNSNYQGKIVIVRYAKSS